MIREIKPQDKKRILEISQNIWEGDDYISRVFDDWVANPNGLFSGLWENGKLVGFGKLTHLTEEDIWLEGLRKDETSGAKGVGEKLSKHYINYLKGKQIRSVRFSTYFGNIASIKLNEKLGFKRLHTLSLKSQQIHEMISIKNDLTKYEFTEVKNYIESSSYLKGTKGFIGKGWVVYEFNEKLLKQFHREKQILVYRDDNQIRGCAIWSLQHYKKIIWISFLEAESEHILHKLLTEINNIGYDQQKKEMQILVPDGKLLEFCHQNNFTSWQQDHDFLLYELPKTLIAKITGS
ncbi:MAG: GNAT family N-acetyltransferase [Candidatus Cloacimonetes bacterium]|nr:GNAT family N-acetyltransferase [Candidatus Cloacimonadota bacterium]MCF7814219.1 GNAT family N-acetyltransferase [Candidatus Cloacimonadota bacterium]MCF7868122.1 GNAT family N-acetyltransferase [Candidatus Cloacimonadota bacterium]MCF7883588.1 GNAT family N-acetyltransferase [Candidatus Cloacimonadota bacterium]